jgi:hypothetical protein
MAATLLGLIPCGFYIPLSGQGPGDRLPSSPTMPNVGFMHGVPKDYTAILGPIEIRTGEISLDAKQDTQGPDPAIKTSKYWFQSPTGVVRYFSPDHTKILWEGRYRELSLIALISETSDGKDHVSIPVGSLWATSVSVDTAPAVTPLMGSDISIPKLVGGFWNVEAIDADYNAKREVSSQTGTFRFIDSQPVTLPAARLTMPSCQLDATLAFKSVPQSTTAFDFKLGESQLVINSGRFASAALVRPSATRLDCTGFHAVLATVTTGVLTADISAKDITFRSSITAATGAFLAKIGGPLAIPAIGRGRLSTTSIEATTLRAPDAATIDQLSVAGLRFVTHVTPGAANFRTLANDVGNTLALPDFLSPEQQQLKEIAATAAALTELTKTTSDVLVHIPGDEINVLVAAKLKEVGIPNAISFGFGKQEILAFVPAPRANSPVSLVLHLAAAIEDTYVSVRTSVSFAPLSSLSSTQIGPGKTTLAQLAGYLLAKLAPVINPLTKLDTEIKVPIPTNDVYPVDLTKTIHDDATGANITITSDKTKVAVAIPQKALLIDPDGLHLLLHVDVN